MSGNAVMSWQRLVSAVLWVPGPWSPPGQRPPARPVSGSRNTNGRLTTAESSGLASGTWMTSMRKSALSGFSAGDSSEQPAISSAERTPAAPEP